MDRKQFRVYESATSLRLNAVHLTVLVIVCTALFANTLPNKFVWDDTCLITGNAYIRNIKNIPLFFTPHYWSVLHPIKEDTQYRPVRTISLAIDYFLWGLNPAGYHLTNLLLHTANVILIFYLVHLFPGRIKERHEKNSLFFTLPFLTALLFAAHPVHTESIALVKNRSELLACFFFLTAVICFIKAAHLDDGRMRGLTLSMALVCFGLAFLSKENALSLPAVLALYAVCFLPTGARRSRAVLNTVPFWSLALLYFWFRLAVLSASSATPLAIPGAGDVMSGPWHVLMIVIKTVGYYLSLLVAPINLHVIHAFTPPSSFLEPVMVVSAAAVLMLLGLIVLSRRRSALLCFGTGWVLLTLLPAANIFYLFSRPIAEQRLYLPSLGFCLIVATAIDWLYEKKGAGGRRFNPEKTVAVLTLSAVFIFYSVQTVHRNHDWRDKLTLWTDGVNKTPLNARVHAILGRTYAERGEYTVAAEWYRKAITLNKGETNQELAELANIYNNLGVTYGMQKAYDKAREYLQKALAVRTKILGPGHPDTAQTLGNLGLFYYYQGNSEMALNYIHQAQAIFLQTSVNGLVSPDVQRTQKILQLILRKKGVGQDG